ncbi:hypothetical protein HPB47_018395 [Ixodes persulcatus]|uniref:Uncharacterized protein n=1 Tax=Ixodes persulcatus TaxID=34615 RepID=A0AC60QKV1_IXOPE|nr:hypothetical protein HPB47_018395 [Ixodes persulcatus]
MLLRWKVHPKLVAFGADDIWLADDSRFLRASRLAIRVTARLHFSAPTFLPDRDNAVLVNEYGNHRDEAHPRHESAAHLLENHAPRRVIEMAWTTSASTSSSKTAAPPRDNYIYGWNHLAALRLVAASLKL